MADRRRPDRGDDEDRPRGGRRDRRFDERPFRPRREGPHHEGPRHFERPAGRREPPDDRHRPPEGRYRPPEGRDRPPEGPREGYRGPPGGRPGPREGYRGPPGGRPGPGFAGRPGEGRYRPDSRARPVSKPRVDTTGLVEPGEELIAGRHPVQEAFAARREAVRLLVVPERRAALEALVLHATTLRIPVVEVEGGTLTSLCGFDGHQGVALVAMARPAATMADILALAGRRGERPFVLVLDSLEDPQNLGTLLRSAEACGVHGVVYPERRAAPLTPSAIKASAGATEHLLLAAVPDLGGAIADLRARGVRAVGADQAAALTYAEADLRGPLALVIGSEGFGISGQLRRRLDMTVRIPMRGRIASLNAAVAGSVLLFAAAEQRGAPESADRVVAADSGPDPLAANDEPSSTEGEPASEDQVGVGDDAPADDAPTDEGEGGKLLPA